MRTDGGRGVKVLVFFIKGGMYSSPEIHGFSPGGFQYGVFRISVRIPIFAMAKMAPRESQLLAVGVVRLAPNLHMFDSTHQDVSLHRECLLISDGKGCPVAWFIGTAIFQHSRG